MEDRDDPVLRDILDRAVEVPLERRAAFLDGACGGNAQLRAEVSSLLLALDQANDFLASPGVDTDAPGASADVAPSGPRAPAHDDALGTRVGPYVLRKRIGEGGMGIVYLAEQEKPVRRRVAVKVIKPGMDSAAVIARFEAERQALAVMDHPNIARVLEVGATDAGRPYFVMDLVEGIPVTQYCDSKRLAPRERLGLFIPVCHAIQHAHQKGIIHRDIKPTNVLVTVQDGKPVPKVIDFGVAKALNQHLTELTLFTQVGSVVGTLEYMSPEQAEADVRGTDTRTDVYSLGVLLYELLTGTTPLDVKKLREAGYQEMLRAIRLQEPPKPSTRLSASGDALASLSALRQTEPKKLSRLMVGELDLIVMKCLEKDREKRYQTANGLARDIERYLTGEPVEASPPSATYRLRKLVARHRVAVGLVALIVVSLLAGLVVSTIALRRARWAEGVAQAEQGRAQEEQRHAQTSAAMLRLQQGNAFISLGRLGQAETQFELARAELTRLKGDAWIADLGMWDLSRQANPPIAEWPMRSERIVGARFLTDGRTAVVLQEDGTLQQIEMPYGRVIRRHQINGSCVKLAFSGDGHQAFISDTREDLYAWSLDDKPPRLVLANAGKLLAVDHLGQRTLHVARQGVAIRHADGRVEGYVVPGTVMGAGFLSNDRFVTAGDHGGGINFWQVGRSTPLRTFAAECYHGFAVAPDGARVAISTWNDEIQVYEFGEGKLERMLTGHTGRIPDLAWSSDQNTLFSASWDGTVRAWDVKTGSVLRICRGSNQPLTCVSASSDGHRILAGGWEGTARLWDVRRVPSVVEFRCGETKYGKSFALFCDDRLLAVGDANFPMELFDRFTGVRLGDLGPESKTSGFHRGVTQTELVYGAFDGTAVVYDLESRKPVATLGTPQPNPPELQTYSWRAADAPTALVWRRGRDLVAWDLVTRKPIRRLNTGHTNWQTNISRDGRFAMAFGDLPEMGIILYSIGSPVTLMRESAGGGGVASFSNDGQFLLTRRYQVDAFAQVWKTSDLSPVHKIDDGDSVYSGDWFWPDDRHLLSPTQSRDQVLRDAQTGDVLYTVSKLGYLFNSLNPEIWIVDGLTYMICDLRWPDRRRQLRDPARQAMEKLASGSEDADSQLTLGQWFALHGVDDWAVMLLNRARQQGKTVDPEQLAACYARMGDPKSAAAEYERALDGATTKSQATYLRFCLSHYRSAGPATSPATGPAGR